MIPDNVCPSFTSCAVTHSFTFDLRIGISIIPNTYPSFADFSSDVVITSGISKPATTYYHPPGYESGDVDLPTYRDALEGNDGAAAPSNVFSEKDIHAVQGLFCISREEKWPAYFLVI